MNPLKYTCTFLLLTLLFGACKKKEDKTPEPETPVTPAPDKELSFRVIFQNYYWQNTNPYHNVPMEGMEVTISSSSDLNSVLLSKNANNTKKTDKNGRVKFTYTELKNIGISGSQNIQALACSDIFSGWCNGSGYLSGNPFLFDDRSTYGEYQITVKAYVAPYLKLKNKWKLVYASVNNVVADINNTCNKDDYMIYTETSFAYANFEYRDSTNSCTGFPDPKPKSYINYQATSSPASLSGNIDTLTKKFIFGTQSSVDLQASDGNFWGYGLSFKLMLNDTLRLQSQTQTSQTVIKKFVAMP